MKTYFKVIAKVIGFGKKPHDTGYAGLIINVSEIELSGGDKFFIETYGSNKHRLQENKNLISYFIDEIEFAKHLLSGRITQISEESFKKEEHICTGWCNCSY